MKHGGRTREHLERELAECRRQHGFVNKVMQSIGVPIYVIDARDYGVTVANRPDTVPQDVKCYSLLHHRQTPCEGEGQVCPLDEVKRSKKAVLVEHMHYDGNGLARHFEVQAFPILDDTGAVTHVVEYNVDVTERKRIEDQLRNHERSLEMLVEELERSNAELKEFASIAAHDIRSPMSQVSLAAVLLKETLEDKLDAEQERVLDIIVRGIDRTAEVISALYRCSQVGSGELSIAEVDPNALVEELKNFQLRAELERSRGRIDVPERLHVVCGDEPLILELLQNLIANGLKFHRPGVPPEIRIRSREADNDKILLEVEDNGIGIKKADRKKIFDMFQRLHDGGGTKGAGIGLALCKKVVERHGGRIGVRSDHGSGSTFWVELPKQTTRREGAGGQGEQRRSAPRR